MAVHIAVSKFCGLSACAAAPPQDLAEAGAKGSKKRRSSRQSSSSVFDWRAVVGLMVPAMMPAVMPAVTMPSVPDRPAADHHGRTCVVVVVPAARIVAVVTTAVIRSWDPYSDPNAARPRIKANLRHCRHRGSQQRCRRNGTKGDLLHRRSPLFAFAFIENATAEATFRF